MDERRCAHCQQPQEGPVDADGHCTFTPGIFIEDNTESCVGFWVCSYLCLAHWASDAYRREHNVPDAAEFLSREEIKRAIMGARLVPGRPL